MTAKEIDEARARLGLRPAKRSQHRMERIEIRVATLVRAGESQYGTRQPYMRVALRDSASFRVLNAALSLVEARVELATARCTTYGGWIVRVDSERSVVYLELADGTEGEEQVGLAVLQTVANEIAEAGGVLS